MPRHDYTEAFELFWNAYPRKTAKLPAFKAWKKLRIEDDAFLPKQIVGDIEKRTRFKYWSHDQTKIPHPATWLNAARWEDEGWEDERKTRGKESVSPLTRTYTPTVDDGPKLSDWQRMCNRLMLVYSRVRGGLLPDQLQQALRIKKEILDEMESSLDEEVSNDASQRGAMALMLADIFLQRLDTGLGFDIRNRVLTDARVR